MPEDRSRERFWWRWIVANGLAELVGLGTVALVGLALARIAGEPSGAAGTLAMAAAAVVLGAFEGAVVGWAQHRVLRAHLPSIRGWTRATVFGAMAAWALGILPSTVMKLVSAPGGSVPAEPSMPVVLALACALGIVAGPLLAGFQWLSLRRALPRTAILWLPANAAAWALGMPVIFLGIRAHELGPSPAIVAAVVALSLLLAGGVVGAVHGRFLLWMIRSERVGDAETRGAARRSRG